MRLAPMKYSRSSKTSVSISRRSIEVDGIRIEVLLKPIKNLHLSVHPPTDVSGCQRRRT